jgi:hypothetical protein
MITSISGAIKCSERSYRFHDLVVASINSDTMLGGCCERAQISRSLKSLGSQLSCHMPVFVPVPILFISPKDRIPPPSLMDRYTCDGFEPSDASKSCTQRDGVSHEPPCLSCQEGKVKKFNVPESHAAHELWFGHCFP